MIQRGPSLTHVYSGKVRELYETADGVLLLVATDRISAFDYVLEPEIPDKGKILTQLSLWWFAQLADIAPNHLVDAPVPARFAGRAMACRRLDMIPVECVARGYLTGSALADYAADRGGVRDRAAARPDRRLTACRGRSSPPPPRRPGASTTRTSRCPR